MLCALEFPDKEEPGHSLSASQIAHKNRRCLLSFFNAFLHSPAFPFPSAKTKKNLRSLPSSPRLVFVAVFSACAVWRSAAMVVLRIGGTWEDAGVSLFLVLFGGVMSGLTLGLMSLDLVELEVLQRSGTPTEQRQAATVLPVVQKQHQLLVTLVLCNAIAMEALPVFLDNMVSTLVAVILSVTFVLAFGEVIPQAICSRNGLAIGANLSWLVRVLMLICFPVGYPVGKLLDLVLGHNTAALFRRSQLKAFVSIHGKEEGRGGELSQDETTIIKGALDLTMKTVAEAMTPIESTYSIAVDTRLNWEALGRILATGHSRIPVYSGDPKNLIGLLLVKSLITVRAEDEMPVSAISIRKLPRVAADTPLYDMLNEFQKGQSHMAAVVSMAEAGFQTSDNSGRTVQVDDFHNQLTDDSVKLAPECTSSVEHLSHQDGMSDLPAFAAKDSHDCKVTICSEDFETCSNVSRSQPGTQAPKQSCTNTKEEVIGIITLEDVFEELIQEEIVDETDEYVDVHKRVKVTNGIPPSFFHRNVDASRNPKAAIQSSAKTSSKAAIIPSLKPTVYNLATPLLHSAQGDPH